MRGESHKHLATSDGLVWSGLKVLGLEGARFQVVAGSVLAPSLLGARSKLGA